MKNYDHLLEQYVSTFSIFDDMTFFLNKELPPELSTGMVNKSGSPYWRPARLDTAPSWLQSVYSHLPARFPELFERFVLTYRWAEVDLGTYRLLANLPGPDLSGLIKGRDPYMYPFLLSHGYIQFGSGPDADYDAVCFDLSSRKKSRDFKVVKIDHEGILCFDRIKVVATLAENFEGLVRDTIERARAKMHKKQ